MWSVIKFLSCSMSIDDVYYHPPYFDMFVWRSFFVPYKVRNITTQSILSSAGDLYGIRICKTTKFFLVARFQQKRSRDILKYLIRTFTWPLKEDAYPPVVWTILFILWHVFINSEDLDGAPSSSTLMNATLLSWFINSLTKKIRISRGKRLLLDGNPKG